jgi:hypothetical protein
MTVDREAVLAKLKAERRKHLRVPVNLSGRLFVPEDGREALCRITDMSPGGAQVACDFVPALGTDIVLYVDGFGRFEAEVSRPDEGCFGVRFHCSALKRDRVAEQLAVLMNRGFADESVLRRHERVATQGLAHFTLSNGETVPCQVLDLSLSGLSLKTNVRPRVGETVMIGQMSGRVVRHHETGIAIEFAKVQAEKPNRQLLRIRR